MLNLLLSITSQNLKDDCQTFVQLSSPVTVADAQQKVACFTMATMASGNHPDYWLVKSSN